MRWLRGGVIVTGGVGFTGWGWWLDRRPTQRFEVYRDPDTGVLTTVVSQAVTLPTYSLAAVALTLLIGVTLHRRGDDIRIGFAALRERPAVLSLAALAWAAVSPSVMLLLLLWMDRSRQVPAGSHITHWVLADPPFAWFIGTAAAAMAGFCAVAGPWWTDHYARVVRYSRRLTRLQRRAADRQVLMREIVRLGDEMAERPYREHILISLLVRGHARRLGDEFQESLLRTLARVPRLEEPGWRFRLSLWTGELTARYSFADALTTAFAYTRARPHLDVAIRILEGLHRCPPILVGRGKRPWVALTLALALCARHDNDMTPDGRDLDRARHLTDWAATRLPENATTTTAMAEMRFRLMLSEADRDEGEKDLTTLDQAIDALRQEDPSPGLVLALIRRYRVTGKEDALREAIVVGAEMIDDGQFEGIAHEMLLHALVQKSEWWSAGGPGRDLMVDTLDRVDALPRVSPRVTQYAGAIRASLALMDGDHEAGFDHYERALTSMARSASLGLSREDQQLVLSRAVIRRPNEMAQTALALGQVERAVHLLELGRTVIWSQIHRLRRATPPPGVAVRLAELRVLLDQPSYPDPAREDDLLAGHHAATIRAELAAEWEALTAEHDLARGMSYPEVREAAGGGPVVIVNVGDTTCDAVIVLADRAPIHVRLDEADPATVATWTAGLLAPTTRRINARAIARVLWDTIAAPILPVLEPHLGPDRRVWWCPTGPLVAVPLHLAGHHDRKDGPALIDEVVSSYTPSLWALRDARRAWADAGAGANPTREAMLTVSVRDAPDQPSLPHADEEAARVAARFPAARWLTGPAATVAGTRNALPHHRRVHLACHGDQGGLVLSDGRLGLDELAGMDLAGGRLAFLSACVTALPDARTVDEVLHPAAAFHLGGFTHVVGTQWDIVSSDAPAVADDFYGWLTSAACDPATALHRAQQRLRAAAPNDPARWAPFVHIGP